MAESALSLLCALAQIIFLCQPPHPCRVTYDSCEFVGTALKEESVMIVNVWKRGLKSYVWACVMAAGLMLTACSGGGSSDPTTATTGQAVVSLTDAAGDFLSY